MILEGVAQNKSETEKKILQNKNQNKTVHFYVELKKTELMGKGHRRLVTTGWGWQSRALQNKGYKL
jgi:hypothetical protein